ncbi:hypothetical protein JGU66_13590 [Myxococcaceae bacterium JPH2]|nr:hypothetical protein [Myxococcaceae bacterium JPH2]
MTTPATQLAPESLTESNPDAADPQLQYACHHHVMWSEESVLDERSATHLWLLHRALELLENLGPSGADPRVVADALHIARFLKFSVTPDLNSKRPWTDNTIFHDAMVKGLYDCDWSNPWISTCTWQSHFYNPVTKKSVDTGLNGNNPTGKVAPIYAVNAIHLGQYERLAVANPDIRDLIQFFYYLGIALHYFEDLTQPMHAHNFPNFIAGAKDVFHKDFEAAAQDYVNTKPEALKVGSGSLTQDNCFAFGGDPSTQTPEAGVAAWIIAAAARIGHPNYNLALTDADQNDWALSRVLSFESKEDPLPPNIQPGYTLDSFYNDSKLPIPPPGHPSPVGYATWQAACVPVFNRVLVSAIQGCAGFLLAMFRDWFPMLMWKDAERTVPRSFDDFPGKAIYPQDVVAIGCQTVARYQAGTFHAHNIYTGKPDLFASIVPGSEGYYTAVLGRYAIAIASNPDYPPTQDALPPVYTLGRQLPGNIPDVTVIGRDGVPLKNQRMPQGSSIKTEGFPPISEPVTQTHAIIPLARTLGISSSRSLNATLALAEPTLNHRCVALTAQGNGFQFQSAGVYYVTVQVMTPPVAESEDPYTAQVALKNASTGNIEIHESVATGKGRGGIIQVSGIISVADARETYIVRFAQDSGSSYDLATDARCFVHVVQLQAAPVSDLALSPLSARHYQSFIPAQRLWASHQGKDGGFVIRLADSSANRAVEISGSMGQLQFLSAGRYFIHASLGTSYHRSTGSNQAAAMLQLVRAYWDHHKVANAPVLMQRVAAANNSITGYIHFSGFIEVNTDDVYFLRLGLYPLGSAESFGVGGDTSDRLDIFKLDDPDPLQVARYDLTTMNGTTYLPYTNNIPSDRLQRLNMPLEKNRCFTPVETKWGQSLQFNLPGKYWVVVSLGIPVTSGPLFMANLELDQENTPPSPNTPLLATSICPTGNLGERQAGYIQMEGMVVVTDVSKTYALFLVQTSGETVSVGGTSFDFIQAFAIDGDV